LSKPNSHTKVNEYTEVENANLQGLSQAGAPVMTRSSSSSPSINSNSPKVKIPTKVSGALIIQNRLRAWKIERLQAKK